MPVFSSGVRLVAKLTPQGPAQAVWSPEAEAIHGPDGAGGGGSCVPSGWPDSRRLSTSTGPCGPICFGLWQSPQPMAVTRYFPRSTEAGADAVAALGAQPDASREAPASITPPQRIDRRFMTEISSPVVSIAGCNVLPGDAPS